MPKRSKGEGTVAKRKDGRYAAALPLPRDPVTGKRRRVWFYGKTQAEAVAAKNKAAGQIQAGTFVEPTKVTVGQWLDTWLKEYCKPSVRHTTWQQYEYLIRIHLKPGLGHVILKNLRPEQVQAFYNAKHESGRIKTLDQAWAVFDLLQREGKALGPTDIAGKLGKPLSAVEPLIARMLRDGYIQRIGHGQYQPGDRTPTESSSRGLSARTVRIMHVVLHEALEQAMKNGLVARNVTDATSLPRRKKREIRFFSPEEQGRFLDTIGQYRLGPAFLLTLATGLRRSETLGLKWPDLDLSKGFMTVSRGLVEVRDPSKPKGQRSKLVLQDTKTDAGKRTIPIPADVLPVLKAWKARQAEEKLFLGQEYDDKGFVFATDRGKPVNPREFHRSMNQALARAGIDRAGVHALRHSFATRLLEENVHPRTVQELLGDSTISVVLDTYSHVSMDLKQKAAETMNQVLRLKTAHKGKE